MNCASEAYRLTQVVPANRRIPDGDIIIDAQSSTASDDAGTVQEGTDRPVLPPEEGGENQGSSAFQNAGVVLGSLGVGASGALGVARHALQWNSGSVDGIGAGG